MKVYDYVGKKLVAIDIRAGISPCVQGIIDASVDEKALLADLEAKINALFRKAFPRVLEWTMADGFKMELHPRTRVIRLHKEEHAESEASMVEIQESCQASMTAREERIDANPDNGKFGWWRVEGIRHSAAVRCSSEREAIEKSGIDSWESPSAQWIGKDCDVIQF